VADSYKVMAQSQPSTTTAPIYTVPGSTMAIVRSIVIVNTDSTPRTVDMFVNGSAEANRILPTTTLQVGERIELNTIVCLGAGNTIQAKADVTAKVTVSIFGLEIS
jgi:hypothetical protein